MCLTAAAAVVVIDQSHPLLHNFLKWHLLRPLLLFAAVSLRASLGRSYIHLLAQCSAVKAAAGTDYSSIASVCKSIMLSIFECMPCFGFSRFHLSLQKDLRLSVWLAHIVSCHMHIPKLHEMLQFNWLGQPENRSQRWSIVRSWIVIVAAINNISTKSSADHSRRSICIIAMDGWSQSKNLFAEKYKSRLIR